MASDPAWMVRSAMRRRTLLAGVAAFTIVATAPAPGCASPPERAQALVARLSQEMLALINSGRSEAQLYGEFESILARYGDMPTVAQAILGPPWRSASQAQRQQFVAAFQSYIARRYGRQFRDYQQASIAVQRVRDAGDRGVLVETRLTRPGQQPLAVAWQVSERSGQPRIVNLVIEGISMLANERAEIGAMLEAERGSLDGLIRALRSRA